MSSVCHCQVLDLDHLSGKYQPYQLSSFKIQTEEMERLDIVNLPRFQATYQDDYALFESIVDYIETEVSKVSFVSLEYLIKASQMILGQNCQRLSCHQTPL